MPGLLKASSSSNPTWKNSSAPFFVLLLFAWTVAAQQVTFSPGAERLYETGLEEFNEGRFTSAATTFKLLVAKYPGSHRATAGYLMAAESYFRESKYDSALSTLKPIFIYYPESTLLPQATILMAKSYSRTGDGINALVAAFVALNTAHGPDTIIVMQAARKIIARWGSPKMLDSLLVIFTEKDIRDIVRAYAELRLSGHMVKEEGERKNRPQSARHVFRIGVLLRKFDREPGTSLVRELRRGMHEALSRWKSRSNHRVDVDSLFYTTEKEIRDSVQRWERDDRVIACIGGVYTKDATPLLRLFEKLTIPLLVPLANGADLEPNGAAFLLNSSVQERARAAALFCATTLRAKRGSILAPLSDLGKQMANAFLDEATRLGMRVRGISWYKPNTMNFIVHFTSLKNALESKDSLDVLYLPLGGLRSRSRRIITGLNQVGLRTCLIGSDEWRYSLSDWSMLLDGTSMYCTASIFPSSGSRSKENVPRDASASEGFIMGYNAMWLLLRAIESGADSRDALKKALEKNGLITGFKTAISLSSKGKNQAVSILRYEGGKFKLEQIIDRANESR